MMNRSTIGIINGMDVLNPVLIGNSFQAIDSKLADHSSVKAKQSSDQQSSIAGHPAPAILRG